MSNGSKCVRRLRVAPFLLCGAYAVQVLLTLALPDADAVRVAAQLVCTCPLLCIVLLWVGAPFKFCKWWRAEALLPVLPAAAGILAHYGVGSLSLWIAATVAVFAGSIYNGIKILRHG